MGQLIDIPYSTINNDKRAYEIMILRDQYDNTFADIAREFEISIARATQIYNKIKIKQIRLYINNIAIVLGYENTSQIRKVYNDAYECYQDRSYACAYLEKKYKDILAEYRAGEPGMPMNFIKTMPPFRPKLSKKTIACIVEMREIKKLSFVTIAKEMRMTQAKAKHTYDWFYHKQVLELIKVLEEKAENSSKRMAIWNYYFEKYKTSKKRYDALTKE